MDTKNRSTRESAQQLVAWDGTADSFLRALQAVERNTHIESDLAVLYETLHIAVVAAEQRRNWHLRSSDRELVARKIVAARELRGYTQSGLARALCVSPVEVWRHEQGSNGISLARIVTVARILQLPLDWFVLP